MTIITSSASIRTMISHILSRLISSRILNSMIRSINPRSSTMFGISTISSNNIFRILIGSIVFGIIGITNTGIRMTIISINICIMISCITTGSILNSSNRSSISIGSTMSMHCSDMFQY